MVLQAVMVIVDNSEPSRNGDYAPTRFEAQADTANLIFSSVSNSHMESAMGLMSMGGKGPEVLVTLTRNQGQIYEGLHRTQSRIRGSAQLCRGIHIAYLALKHRENKTQRQRIVVFVCSPIEDDPKDLVKLAKKLKKENVNVDIVLIGALDGSTREKLEAFISEVNKSNGSHLEVVPPSSKLLSDQLIGTPILNFDDDDRPAASNPRMGGGGDDFGELGFDPASDPELALALRMSLEDEKARQEKRAKEDAAESKKTTLEDVEEESESKPLLGKDKKDNSKDKDGDERMDTS